MSVISSSILAGASGAAGGGGDPVYVDDVFSTYLYDGTEGTSQPTQSITTGIDNTEESLIWIKARTGTTAQYLDHVLFDTSRGVKNYIRTNSTGGEAVDNSSLTAFNNNGFTTGASANTNSGTAGFVAWNFKAAPGFFDVVTFSGTGSTQNISHSLGSVPGTMLVRCLVGTHDWEVYHRSTGATKSLHLNQTAAATTDSTVWNNTTPTVTQFTVGTSNNVNQSGHTYVAYLFAHDDASFGTGGDESIIKCGTYGLTSGFSNQTIDLGFEPQWLLIKRTDSSGSWSIIDNMRGLTDASTPRLRANLANAEQTTTPGKIVPNATGFTAIEGSSDYLVGPSSSYIYMAIRRLNKPLDAFDPPLDATDVFAMDTGSSSSTIPTWDSGFPVDFALARGIANAQNWWTITRLTGDRLLQTNVTDAEASGGLNWVLDSMTGWGKNYNSGNLSWMFKRAPGFMDAVTFSGNGTAGRTVAHNLTSVPEMMIVKRRDAVEEWVIYHKTPGPTKYFKFNTQSALTSAVLAWNDTAPTSSSFTLGNHARTNGSGATYVNYLFATLPGISKVGSYSGNTGYAVNVPCGFTNGARFILIKRTDSAGDWYVWDTLRGIASGNDPYLLLNSTAAEVTNTDYIDPLSTGFTVTASAPAALNATGGTYIFLAIA